MKQIITDNQALIEVLESNGISVICDAQMRMVISNEDADSIEDIVAREAPAAVSDYTLEDIENLTYDVVFNDSENSNNKGFKETIDYCKDYILHNNGTNESYFEDYKGGTVQVVCNETGEVVYEEEVR